MGWGRTLLLGDIGNRLDIEDCERSITMLRKTLRQNARMDRGQDEEIRELRREIDDLKLCVGAISSILDAKGIVDKNALSRVARVIDDDDVARYLAE